MTPAAPTLSLIVGREQREPPPDSAFEVVPTAIITPAGLNAAIARARGQYVCFHSRSVWHADGAAAAIRFLDAHPACGVAGITPGNGGGELTLRPFLERLPVFPLSAAVIRRDAALTAGLFDEGIREGYDTDLWLRLALRRATIGVLPSATALPQEVGERDRVSDIEALVSALERFAHRHLLDAPTRTAVRVRTMRLIDRLEIEQAKCRIVEGQFDAARFHLSCARRPSWQVRLAMLALRLTPTLARVACRRVPAVTAFL